MLSYTTLRRRRVDISTRYTLNIALSGVHYYPDNVPYRGGVTGATEVNCNEKRRSFIAMTSRMRSLNEIISRPVLCGQCWSVLSKGADGRCLIPTYRHRRPNERQVDERMITMCYI